MRSESAQKVLEQLCQLGADMDDSLSAEDSVAEVLFNAATRDGKYMDELFPDAKKLAEYRFSDPQLSTVRKWHAMKTLSKNFNHEGRNCGRKFAVDEPIYRCRDCGFDETCVLCVHCFNKDDHIGHQVTTSIASSYNTGVCDCGDTEAWKNEIHCKCSKPLANEKDSAVFDESYKNHLRDIFDSCLEYIIEVFAHENQTLLSIQPNIIHRGGDVLEDELKHTQEVMNGIHDAHRPVSYYYLVFWNDEVHNYEEAQNAIQVCGGIDPLDTLAYARDINDLGRVVLVTKKTTAELRTPLLTSFSVNFAATMMDHQQYGREELAVSIVSWMQQIINHPNQSFQRISRQALGESLCGEYVIPADHAPYWQPEMVNGQYGGLLDGSKLPSDLKSTSNATQLAPPMYGSTRLKYLLFFEPRYWKELRVKMHEFLVSSLMSDLKIKQVAAHQVIDIYGLLLKNMLMFDREPIVTFLEDFCVQFLTCPKTTTSIASKSLDRLMGSCADVFSQMLAASTQTVKLIHSGNDRRQQLKMTQSSILRSLKFIFEKSTILPGLYTPGAFYAFCKIVSYCDDCYTIRRKEGEHVLTENVDFLFFNEIVSSVVDLINSATDEKRLREVDLPTVKECTIKLLRGASKFRNLLMDRSADRRVSSSDVSFFHPSSVLAGKLLGVVSDSVESLQSVVENLDLFSVGDGSLRRIVLNAQIESRFWVRNGHSALNFAGLYTGRSVLSTSGNAYTEDIYLNQITMMINNPDAQLLHTINRFELMRWFQGGRDLHDTIYEGKANSVVEHLIGFLYSLLSHRVPFMHFDSSDEREHYKLREMLRYMLFARAMSYTDIEETVEEEILSSPMFEKTLKEVASYSPPKGFEDEGMYSLKKDQYKHIDPLNLAAQGYDLSNNTAIIAKALSGDSDFERTILIPQLPEVPGFAKRIGAFTRSPVFAKFVNLLLENILDSGDEANLGILLHLLHAAILNAEVVHGGDRALEVYLHCHLYENLFAILQNGKFSKAATFKADFLLQSFISKDPNGINSKLVAKFGKIAVDAYNRQRESTDTRTDESEVERKKRLAKERQRRLFDKMKLKQSAFITKNSPELTEELAESHEHSSGLRQCVMCQRFESAQNIIFCPISFVESDIFKPLDTSGDALYLKKAFMSWGEDTFKPTAELIGKPFADALHASSVSRVAVSCNHGFHFACLMEFKMRLSEAERHHKFQCPLCKVRNDVYVPTLLEQDIKQESLESLHSEKWDNFRHSLYNECFTELTPRAISDIDGNFDEGLGAEGARDRNALRIWKVLGSTISQAEIATRIHGDSAYAGFLDLVSEQTYILLRSLFQYSIILYHDYDDSLDDPKYWVTLIETQSMMNAFLVYFFGGQKGFKYLLMQLVTFYSDKYVKRLDVTDVSCEPFTTVDDALLQNFRVIVRSHHQVNVPEGRLIKFYEDDKHAKNVIAMVERLLIVDLKAIGILMKVMVPSFEIKKQDHFSIKTLLSSFDLPSWTEILTVNDRTKEAFGYASSKLGGNLKYPGVVKFLDLPEELSYFSTSAGESYDPKTFPVCNPPPNAKSRIDFIICLMCGQKLFNCFTAGPISQHLLHCSASTTLMLLHPSTNELKLWSKRGNLFYSKMIKAPYLNSHGQGGHKAVMNGRVATLDVNRLKNLVNMWLTGGIYPYLTRTERPRLIRGSGRGGMHITENEILTNMLRTTGVVRGFPGGMNVETFLEMVGDNAPSIDEEDIVDDFNLNWTDEDDNTSTEDGDYVSANTEDLDDTDEDDNDDHDLNDEDDAGDGDLSGDDGPAPLEHIDQSGEHGAYDSAEDEEYRSAHREGEADSGDWDNEDDDDDDDDDDEWGYTGDDGYDALFPALANAMGHRVPAPIGSNAREWLSVLGDYYDDEDEYYEAYYDEAGYDDQEFNESEVFGRNPADIAMLMNVRAQMRSTPAAQRHQLAHLFDLITGESPEDELD